MSTTAQVAEDILGGRGVVLDEKSLATRLLSRALTPAPMRDVVRNRL